jgi:hypothetical protein
MITLRSATSAVGALVLLMAGSLVCRAAEPVLVRDVVDRCIERYRTTDTLLVRCVTTERAVADPVLLYKYHWLPVGMVHDGITSTTVYHRDGRTYVEFEDPWYTAWKRTKQRLQTVHPEIKGDWAAVFTLPYNEVLAHAEVALKESPVSVTRTVFDGTRLWQARSEEKLQLAGDVRPTYSVLDMKSSTGSYFSSTVLDYTLYSFPIPGLPEDNRERRKSYLPYLLDEYPVDTQLPTVDYRGRQCVLIEANNKSSYLLDPMHEFAVVSGTLRTDSGAVAVTFDVEDLQDLGDGVWLPKLITYCRFGVAEEAGGVLTGKLLIEMTIRVVQAERNLPEHLTYFSVEVPAGSIVIDETLVDEKFAGDLSAASGVRPAVSYIMPADKADLDRTILAARRRLAEESVSQRTPLDKLRWWVVGINVCVVTVLLVYMWRRRMRQGSVRR